MCDHRPAAPTYCARYHAPRLATRPPGHWQAEDSLGRHCSGGSWHRAETRHLHTDPPQHGLQHSTPRKGSGSAARVSPEAGERGGRSAPWLSAPLQFPDARVCVLTLLLPGVNSNPQQSRVSYTDDHCHRPRPVYKTSPRSSVTQRKGTRWTHVLSRASHTTALPGWRPLTALFSAQGHKVPCGLEPTCNPIG